MASHQIGAAFAASAAGVFRTQYGTYTLAFLGDGALCLMAAVAVLPIARRRSTGAGSCLKLGFRK